MIVLCIHWVANCLETPGRAIVVIMWPKHRAPCSESLTLSLMLCCTHFKILNNFCEWGTFSFCTRPMNYVVNSESKPGPQATTLSVPPRSPPYGDWERLLDLNKARNPSWNTESSHQKLVWCGQSPCTEWEKQKWLIVIIGSIDLKIKPGALLINWVNVVLFPFPYGSTLYSHRKKSRFFLGSVLVSFPLYKKYLR
jgi:hypothetical protein